MRGVLLDVNETLLDLSGLQPAFDSLGIPDALPLWFARTLRNGFALAAANDCRPNKAVEDFSHFGNFFHAVNLGVVSRKSRNCLTSLLCKFYIGLPCLICSLAHDVVLAIQVILGHCQHVHAKFKR